MPTLEQRYFNIGKWMGDKFSLHKISGINSIRNRQVLCGEVWECNLGFNIGEEKNKTRPVLVISNNRVNRTGKVIVACLTDAQKKINSTGLPIQNSWFLLYSDTTDPGKMYSPNRSIPQKSTTYSFLDKDSVVQLEEIRAVSKARLSRNKLGDISTPDHDIIKKKIAAVFDSI